MASLSPSTTAAVEGSRLLDRVVPLIKGCMTVVAALAVLLAGLLYVKQDSMLYYPSIGGIPKRPRDNPRKYRSPSEHQVPYQEHRIVCRDGVRIHSWLLLRHDPDRPDFSKGGKSPTIVFFHGNAGNIGLRLPNALQMFQYLNANVLLVEYRGYGDSDDAAVNEKGLKLDAEAALEFIHAHPHVDPQQVFLFGRSLGGSVAFHLAEYAQQHNIPLAGIMVENTFLSIAHMVDALMPAVAPIKHLILRIGWKSHTIVPHLAYPVLYLAGANDQLVPHQHMLELYRLSSQTSPSPLVQLHVIPNGTHNESWLQGGMDYWLAMKEFMDQAVAISKENGTCTTASSLSSTRKPFSQSLDGGVATTATTATTTGSASAIPIMPSRLLGMVTEAVGGTSSGTSDKTPAKKDD